MTNGSRIARLLHFQGGQFVGADHELADGSIKGEVPDVLLYFLQRFVKYFQFGPGGFDGRNGPVAFVVVEEIPETP